MADELEVLNHSVARLHTLVESLGPDDLRAQSYDTEWKVADVLSHLGSGAEIFVLSIGNALGGPQADPQPVWDRWNAKDPDAKAADFLRADQALLERLGALSDDERDRFRFSMGPMNLDLTGFVGMRINEHTLHSWDVAVTFDPDATLPTEPTEIVLEAIPMIAGFAGKPTGSTKEIRVRTSTPERNYVLALAPDAISLTPTAGDSGGAADLELPAESFVRLVYGRLDPDHTPAFKGSDADLDELRAAFPGI